MLTALLVVTFLIAVNAFYVLAEFASVSASRTSIRQAAEEGNRLARAVLPIVESPQRLDAYIAVCQVGITLSSLVLGAYGQATIAVALSPWFDGWARSGAAAASTAALVTLLSLTAAQVVLGELVPKSLALQYPVRAALFSYLPMRWSQAVFGWFTWILNGSGLLILRMLGVVHASHRHIHAPDEIDLLISESAEHGVLDAVERRRLHHALQLSARTASQLMVPRVAMAAVDADDAPQAILRAFVEAPFTRLPVYRGQVDQIIGIAHARDLTAQLLAQGGIEGFESRLQPPLIVPETIRATRLIPLMREHRTHIAIVIDETGGVAGLVTIQDVLRDLLGPVSDEFKPEPVTAEPLPDGRVRLPGQMRVHEAETHLGVLWDGEAATVGGRIVEALGHLPEPGERVTIDGVEVEVERIGSHVVEAVLARPLAARGEAP